MFSRQPGKVPLRNARLVAVGVAAGAINGAEDRCRVISVHEGAGAVVDGFTRDRHVVGVHDAMNETYQKPLRDEVRLAGYDLFEKSAVRVRRASRFRVMAGNHVVGEVPDRIHVCADREELKCADADMAGGDAGQDGARLRQVTADALGGRDTASDRVVGMPSATIASLTMYSRRTGLRAARPSPLREKGVGPEPLS